MACAHHRCNEENMLIADTYAGGNSERKSTTPLLGSVKNRQEREQVRRKMDGEGGGGVHI